MCSFLTANLRDNFFFFYLLSAPGCIFKYFLWSHWCLQSAWNDKIFAWGETNVSTDCSMLCSALLWPHAVDLTYIQQRRRRRKGGFQTLVLPQALILLFWSDCRHQENIFEDATGWITRKKISFCFSAALWAGLWQNQISAKFGVRFDRVSSDLQQDHMWFQILIFTEGFLNPAGSGT